MKYINIALTIVVVGLAFWLYRVIQEPIEFNKEKKVRYEKTIKRLKDIRTIQLAYKDIHGEFAGDFNKLVNMIRTDTFTVVKTLGNPDDTTQVVSYDTSYIPVRDSLTIATPLDSLPYIPFTKEKFEINSGEIISNKVPIKVFEVGASNEVILRGLSDQYYDPYRRLKVGSMTEATYSGNWN